ncbi:hypothetical protein BH23GEM4_BH23GEM4_13170 [soil metagenome]|jgi:hypothetical protein
MRKPISKHALRRALERVQGEGLLQLQEPTGPVIDRVWHEIERQAYSGSKKKPSRDTIRQPAVAEVTVGVDESNPDL